MSNLRAGIGAFGDERGNVPQDVESMDFVNRDADCLRLLIATGISFTRPHDGEVGAEGPMQDSPLYERIQNDDVLAAARRAAARVAASWIADSDIALRRAAAQGRAFGLLTEVVGSQEPGDGSNA
jgi:hypothetical protein